MIFLECISRYTYGYTERIQIIRYSGGVTYKILFVFFYFRVFSFIEMENYVITFVFLLSFLFAELRKKSEEKGKGKIGNRFQIERIYSFLLF